MISEYSYSLVVGESSVVEEISEVMNGCLKAIYVDCTKPLTLEVLFDNGYRILSINNFAGQKYFMVRHPCCDVNGNLFNYVSEEFYLNEKVIIRVQGSVGSSAVIKFKVED